MPKIIEDEQIYRDVIRTISENGYSATTTKMMAESAGISEVTLFRKYGSKLKLVKQTISYILSQADIQNVIQYTGDIKADLVRIVQASLVPADKHSNFGFTLLLHIARYPELVDSFEEPQHVLLKFKDVIIRYQKEGILQPEHPLLTVSSLVGPLMYSSVLHRVLPNADLPTIDPEFHVKQFLKGRLVIQN